MAITREGWLQRVGHGALDLLFPPSCVACRVELAETYDRLPFCDACRDELPLTRWPVCERCGARVPEIPGSVPECPRCREGGKRRIWFDQTFALGSYDGLLRELILRMKRDRSERLARALAGLIASTLDGRLAEIEFDAVVPVPMHAWRRLARGTNPATALAIEIGRRLRLAVSPGILRSRHNTRSQLGLTPAGRFQNVRGEFRITSGYSLVAPHVLLVDDVLTTGATCSEAARVLKRGGAKRVSVLVVARTPS